MRHQSCPVAIALVLLSVSSTDAAPAPMRPVSVASARPSSTGPAYYVDARGGDDSADGDAKAPWRTLAHAGSRLKPGDTLYLRGGVYFESVVLTRSGRPGAPITIRSMPGEIAILDGGQREFLENPETSWEPVRDGAPHEFRSTNTYPDYGPWVTGNFADTMIPLHGYKFDVDLRSNNEYWNIAKSTAPGSGIYVGPGVWLDPATRRIHIRLAPTSLKNQPSYRGPTDPRAQPLVIALGRSPLTLKGAKHVRLQDLVLRGSASHTLGVESSEHITLDGVVAYGGAPTVYVRSTNFLTIVRSAIRGLAAPWSSRMSMKYRGLSPYLFFLDSKLPQSHDWEISYSEFTDGHDGIVLDSVKTLRFHHNRLDNFNDDALYLTLTPREAVPTDVQIYENVISRAYTVLAFGERDDIVGKATNSVGPGVYVFRNVFDLRTGTYNRIPTDATAERSYRPLAGRMCGDHGGPVWEPIFFYNNTVLLEGTPWRGYYGAQLVMGISKGTKRRLFNNIFLQLAGAVGVSLRAAVSTDLQVDGNLFWSKSGPQPSPPAAYPSGSGGRDVFADPLLVGVYDQTLAPDVRLQGTSPAIDAGVPLPSGWPDSRRASDKNNPDLGALPAGAPNLVVGPSAAPTPKN